MARTNTLGNFLTDVADAIRTKKGSEELIAAADFDTEIENLPSGGAIEEKDVNFYDYDGTLVNSYTKNEFLALNEMPANPTHNGLTAQGWNWTLEDAQEAAEYMDTLDIGQLYKTDDNTLRIYVTLKEGRTKPYVSFAVNGEATIDWGDNTTSSITGTSTSTEIATQHSYSSAGDYVIKIYSESNLYLKGDGSAKTHLFYDNKSGSWTSNLGYQASVNKIELSSNCVIGEYAFNGLTHMTSISLTAESETVFGKQYLFSECSLLRYITMPFTTNRNLVTIGPYAFYSCKSLGKVSIPKSTTTIANNSFQSSGLIRFNWHKNVSGVQTSAFANCYRLKSVHFPNTLSYLYGGAFSSCTWLESVIFDDGEGTIIINGQSQFSNCSLLSKMKVSRISAIPNYFTDTNQYLRDLTLSDGITSLGQYCFQTCYRLPNLKIPSTVSTIGNYAFGSIISAGFIDFSEHTSIPTLGSDAFKSISADCKIIVPDDLYENWIVATNWSTYADNIISKSDWDALQNA